MTTFTEFLGSVRSGSAKPLTAEEVAELVTHVRPILMAMLRRKYPDAIAFGQELEEDLSHRALHWLLEAVRPMTNAEALKVWGPGRKSAPLDPELPGSDQTNQVRAIGASRVLDTRSLVYFLYDKACKWSYDRSLRDNHGWSTKTDGQVKGKKALPATGGGSKLLTEATDEVTAQSFGSVSDKQRRGGQAVDFPEFETMLENALDAGIEDLQLWFEPDTEPLRVFELSVVEGFTVSQIESEVGLSKATVNRYLRRAKFCIMRRMGYTPDSLKAEFGKNFDLWDRELTELGRAV